MDFESSMFVIKDKDGARTYWNNLFNMMSRLQHDLKNEDSDDTRADNLNNITSFIQNQEISKGSIMNTLILLDMIKETKFIIIKKQSKPIYDPNVY